MMPEAQRSGGRGISTEADSERALELTEQRVLASEADSEQRGGER
jgi:hypothetical protein